MIRIAATAALLLCAPMAQAATVPLVESFDTGLGGWTVLDTIPEVGGTSTIFTQQATGGAPGGYMRIDDTTGGYMQLVAPTGWLGDLTSRQGEMFSFMAKHFSPITGGRYTPEFGRVTLRNGSQSVTADALPRDASTSWQEASIRFLASDFGVSEAAFANILSNVTSLEVNVESWYGIGESIGIDEIRLAAVPLPASGWMLLAGIGALSLRRRIRGGAAA